MAPPTTAVWRSLLHESVRGALNGEFYRPAARRDNGRAPSTARATAFLPDSLLQKQARVSVGRSGSPSARSLNRGRLIYVPGPARINQGRNRSGSKIAHTVGE